MRILKNIPYFLCFLLHFVILKAVENVSQQPTHQLKKGKILYTVFFLFFLILLLGVYFLGLKNGEINNGQHSSQINSNKSSSLATPSFSFGKIAFIKDGNVWVADQNGKATELTHDATRSISETYDHSLEYKTPVWSPSGTKLAFVQVIDKSSSAQIMVSDGKKVKTNPLLGAFYNLPPFWISDDALLITGDTGAMTTSRFDGITWDGVNEPGDPYFSNFSIPNGCGGGGGPDWINKFSRNSDGGTAGIRATFFYIDSLSSVVYSTECDQEQTKKIVVNSTSPTPFFSSKQTEELLPQRMNNVPHELSLSPKRDMIVGVLNGNITLYSLQGKLIKTLTHSAKAYGPIFSPDETTVYYADNWEEKPILKSINVSGGRSKTIYTAKQIGAISNISVSPNGRQIVFTLIEQTTLPNPKKNDYLGAATENIYLVNFDTSDPKLFVKNASQAVWSP